MIKTLVVLVGLLVACGGVTAAWFGVVANDEIQSQEAEIYKQRSENAYRAGRGGGAEAGEKKIADSEEIIEAKKIERNVWFGAGAGALAVGLAMALLPLTGKRKTRPARLELAQEQDAASP